MADQTSLGIGKIITGPQERDAVHFAIAPVMTRERLSPGSHVGLVKGSPGYVSKDANHIGIVDPFLTKPILPGEAFWMFLYPGTITSLRHEWTHPEFETSAERSRAERWLRDFADRHDFTYSDVLKAGREFISDGEYFVQQDSESARSAMYDPETRHAFWCNFSIVTGIEPNEDQREGTVFCCSC